MPATYFLQSASPSSERDAVSRLGKVPGFRVSDDRLTGPGLTSVDVYPIGAIDQRLVRDEFGFTPRIAVAMIPDKFEDFEKGLDSIADLLDTWVREQRGDLILTLDHELPIASHFAGQTTLNRLASFWTNARLERMTIAYRLEKMTAP